LGVERWTEWKPKDVAVRNEEPVMAKRTTMRSSAGKKLYAVRNADGSFKDIQTFERAHAMDIKRGSKAEAATAKKSKKKATKKVAKKAGAKKSTKKATKKTGKKAAKKTSK
jgi:hypothetical protein